MNTLILVGVSGFVSCCVGCTIYLSGVQAGLRRAMLAMEKAGAS